MTEVQLDILDKLHFVEPYQTLITEIQVPENILKNELKDLIQKGWVQVMRFDNTLQDYVSTPFLHTEDLNSCYFLATKEGLTQYYLK